MNREDLDEIVDFNHIETRQRVEHMMAELILQREAKRRLDEASRKYDLPDLVVISSVPDSPKYRIDDLLDAGGHVLLSAQKKVGKTTLVLNLVKALINGTQFLGEFRVHGRGRVAVLDFEMTPKSIGDWIKAIGLLGNEDLRVMQFRGKARALGLYDDDVRDQLVQKLQDFGADILIIDPLGPILRAYGVDENSNSEVGRVIDLLVEIKEDAGVSELVIVHHHGKDGNLGARGASVLEDTPTALWKLTKDDRTGLRTITAEGRDIEAKRSLAFNPDTKELTSMRFDDVYISHANLKALMAAMKDLTGPSTGKDIWELAKGEYGYSSKQDKVNEDLRELASQSKILNEGTERKPLWVLN